MRIGILSQWFDPEPGPAALPAIYGREFVARGHDVRVLTGYPNYPGGELYVGYRMRPRTRTIVDGMTVTRVPLVPSHSASAVGRIANYASFAAAATTLGTGALKGVDALWVYNSPATVTAPMLAHSRWGGVPIFLHVQDLWPDSLLHSGMLPAGRIGAFAEAVIRRVVASAERHAAVVGVISPSVRQLILERNPAIDPDRVVYAPNPTNEALFRPAEELRSTHQISPPDDVVEVMYAGAIGEVQGLDTLLDAAAALTSRRDIRFTIVGDGISRERLERRAVEGGLSNVRFIGRVEQNAIPLLIAQAQIQIVSLADAPFLAHTTPSKISSLLASGVPVVAQLAGDGATLVADSGAGFTVRPGNVDELASAIVEAVDEGPDGWQRRGRKGRAYYEANLSAATVSNQITHSLERAICSRGRTP